jgi:hypothetical protein
MISARVEAYLSRLEYELRRRGPVSTRIIDEVRQHLLDAVEAGIRRGLSVDAAEHAALIRFGPVEIVAARNSCGEFRWREALYVEPNYDRSVQNRSAPTRKPTAWRQLSRCSGAVTLSLRCCIEAPVPQAIRENVSR